ncbi:hypothetical protein KCU65_g3658, partial [Aureobasidium melanogenum]
MDPNKPWGFRPANPGRDWMFWEMQRVLDVATGTNEHARLNEPEPALDPVPGDDEYDVAPRLEPPERRNHDNGAASSPASPAQQNEHQSSPAPDTGIDSNIEPVVQDNNNAPSGNEDSPSGIDPGRAGGLVRARDDDDDEDDERRVRPRLSQPSPVKSRRRHSV